MMPPVNVTQAADTFAFLELFFDGFPEFRVRRFPLCPPVVPLAMPTTLNPTASMFGCTLPCVQDNEFFLTAESYGGVYVPTLAHNLITKPNKINFKGIAIGNPTFRQDGCA